MQVAMFSKHLQELSIEDAGKTARDIGFDGLDLTTRPGGHVAPAEVTEALPRAVEILDALGMSVPMITTAITDATDAHAEETFRTAEACGIRYLKLGYWSYGGFGHLREEMDAARQALERIVPLALDTGVTACTHSHSGNCLTASAHVMAELLYGLDPNAVGAYVDPGHMTVEGGGSGWVMGMDLLADRIRLVGVKDFGWRRTVEGDGQVTWSSELVPLGQGIVRWEKVFEYLRASGFDGVVSFHSEYQGGHSWRDLDTQGVIEQTRRDYETLRPILGR